jgi:large subunit ribosomal protein L9
MKVVLLKNVAKKGKQYEVINVSPGYARNYLIPQRLAVIATNRELKRIAKVKQQEKLVQQTLAKDFEILADKLKKANIQLQRKASKEGKLFGSINQKDIKEALLEKGIAIPDDFEIVIEKPLKKIGKYNLDIVYNNKKIPLEIIIQEAKR